MYRILYKNPRDLKKAKDPEDVKFKIIPHLEILKKFLQTEYGEDDQFKFSCKYDFDK